MPIPTMLLVVAGCVTRAADDAPPPPLVVLVSLDTVRADRLGVFGNQRGLTPNLDAFAAEAVTFTNAWAQANITSMSHASLFTSRYPSELGTVGAEFALAPGAPTLADALTAHGYDTAAFTAGGHLRRGTGLGRGFATFDDHRGLGSFWHTVPRALAWLDGRTAPALLLVHSYDAHAPYLGPPPYGEAWTDPAYRGVMTDAVATVPGTESVRDRWLFPDETINHVEHGLPLARTRDEAGRAALAAVPGGTPLTEADLAYAGDVYDGAVAYADAGFGRLVAGLKAAGRYDDAVLVVFADHGEALGEDGRFGHGHSLADAELHVPLLVHAPGATPRKVDAQVTLLDVLPTICELASVSPPAGARGRSLVPWLTGGAGPETAIAFAEGNGPAISARSAAGRLTASGMMADNPWLAPILAATPLTSPAWALDSTAGPQGASLREALLAWRGSLQPYAGRSEVPGPLRDALHARGYWSAR